MPPITRKEFAAKIKEKYPDYAGVDDSVLVEKMVAKYPEYREQISDYDTQKKNDSATIAKPSGTGSAPTLSKLQLQEGSGFAQVGDPIKPQGTFTPEPVENVPRETLPNSSTQRLFTSDGGRVASDNTKTGLNQDIARPQTKEEKQLTAEQIQTKEDNTKIAIDKSAKALAKAKGLTYDKAKADIETRVNRGEAVLGYVDGEPGLKRVNSFNESFKKSLIETHRATQEVKAFNQMSAADKVAWVEKQQQPKEADPNSEYVGQIESGVGQLLGENAEMMAKGGVAAGIGGGLNALSGGTLALLSPTLQFVAFAPDMAAHKSQQEVLKRYNALRAEHPLVDKVDLMKEAEKGQLPGAIAGMAEAAAFSLPGVTSGIKPAYKTMVGKAVGESLKSGINAATITAGSETGLAALRSAQGIETKPGEDVAAIADAAKGNFEFGTAIHMMAGELVPGAAKMPKRIKSLVKFAVTKDNPNAVEDAAKLANANVELGTITPEVANELVTDIRDYKTALDQVQQPGMKPEVEASVAGLQQKINNLVEKKQGKENPEIDNEIAATNKQIDEIKSGKKPEEVEVDEITGEPIGKATEPTKTQPNEQPNATGDTSLGTETSKPLSETSKGQEKQTTETVVRPDVEPISGTNEPAASPVLEPKANDTVTLPPSIKGGMERKFVFENGEWKQDVGTQKTRVGEPLQKQAQEAFDNANNKGEAKETLKSFEATDKELPLLADIDTPYTTKDGKYTVYKTDNELTWKVVDNKSGEQLENNKVTGQDNKGKNIYQRNQKVIDAVQEYLDNNPDAYKLKDNKPNEIPVSPTKTEPTKTEPNKNSQEASKGEATTKEEPKELEPYNADKAQEAQAEKIHNEFGNFGLRKANHPIDELIDANNSAKYRFDRYSKQGRSAFEKVEKENERLEEIKKQGYNTLWEWANNKKSGQKSGQNVQIEPSKEEPKPEPKVSEPEPPKTPPSNPSALFLYKILP